MKKILFFAFIILLFQNTICAAEEIIPVVQSSDVEIYNSEDNSTFGLKNKNGEIITKAIYKKIILLGDTFWIVQKKNKFGIIDASGNYLIEPKYRHAERIFGKYAKLGNEKDYGLYDERGKIIIEPEYTKIDPLFGQMFLTCKNYKYGVTNYTGKKLLENKFEDIYMPSPKVMRIKHEGEWYEIEKMSADEIELPEGVSKITIEDNDYKVTRIITNTGLWSGYSALTATDYLVKLFSSVSPAYEETIDELMLSHGTDTVSIFMQLGWIPKFPFTYAKKYYNNFLSPNNGPLSEIRTNVKKQIK